MKGGERAARAMYTGLWRVLADWLRVPREAPNLQPGAGGVVRSLRPAEGYLRYQKFKFWAALLLVDVLIIGGWVWVLVEKPAVGLALAPVAWGVAIIPDIVAYIMIHVRYDTMWYIITPRSVRIRRGVWVVREVTITFENVQNVEVHQGPLQRHYGIADVTISTAGGGGAAAGTPGHTAGGGGHQGMLEGIDDAPAVRDLILSCAGRGRTAGLGDEAWDARTASFGAEHLAALRAIRDALRPS